MHSYYDLTHFRSQVRTYNHREKLPLKTDEDADTMMIIANPDDPMDQRSMVGLIRGKGGVAYKCEL
jgi:hypothetical protein